MSLISNKLRSAALPPEYGNPPHWFLAIDNVSLSDTAVDSGDNIIAVGTTSTFGAGSNDIFLVKYDTEGSLLWANTIGNADSQTATDIAIDSSDNIIITGQARIGSTSTYNSIVVKLNSSGTLLWKTAIGIDSADFIADVTIDKDDNIIIVGYQASATTYGSQDAFIAKYSSAGSILWRRRLGGTSGDGATAVDTDSAGNIYFGGDSNSIGTNYSFYLVQFDTNGNLSWARKVQYGRLGGIKVNRDTNQIYAVGQELYDGAGNSSNTYFIRYSSNGTLLTRIRFGPTAASGLICNRVDLDRAGNVILTGNFTNTKHLYISKRTSTGTKVWDRLLSSSSNTSSTAYSLSIDSTDNIISVKSTSTGSGFVKLHPDGIGTGTYGSYEYTDANTEVLAQVYGLEASASFSTGTSGILISSGPTLTVSSAAISDTLVDITV